MDERHVVGHYAQWPAVSVVAICGGFALLFGRFSLHVVANDKDVMRLITLTETGSYQGSRRFSPSGAYVPSASAVGARTVRGMSAPSFERRWDYAKTNAWLQARKWKGPHSEW